ncbi:MAG: hypothetical protein ACRD1W_07105 [Vicinamibacterales bacterium]
MGLAAWGLGLTLSVWCPPSGGYVTAQEHHQPPTDQKLMGVEPIRCWRQATVGAVTVGEQFTVVLTCAVFDSADTQVVPDESRLNVASIQMAPFEILGGSHPPDVRRGSRRFFQYDYQLRIIGRDAVGRDVNVPALTISYRIHSRVGAAAKLEGRDLSYLLPALPIKVLSLVPADADDIRDGADASLAAVEALRSRSRIFEAVAIALGVVAGIMVVLALVPVARRTGPAADRNAVPNRAILTAAVAALREEQTRAARDGWTDDTIAGALASMRLIAAAAIDHPISQKPLSADRPVPDGRLRADHGWPRRRTATISSAVTPEDLARTGSRDGATTLTRTQQLDELRASLAALTAALYRREPKRDAASLDEAVRQATSMAEAMARERTTWIPRWARR